MKMVFLKLSETEAKNLFFAVGNFLTGDPTEEEDFFGSPQDVNAARRAQKKIREALKTRSSRDRAPAPRSAALPAFNACFESLPEPRTM